MLHLFFILFLSLIALFELYMRLLDSISIVNSRQGIRPFKLEHTKLLDCDENTIKLKEISQLM